MDGLIVDSEPYWRIAEREVFSSVGVPVTDQGQMVTTGMTTAEVARYWFEQHPWEGPSLEAMELAVVSRVADLVADASAMPGAVALLHGLRLKGLRIALASNSPECLCRQVLSNLELSDLFHEVQSAEHVRRGKPDPEVYLSAADKLSVPPNLCLAFEDSLVGAKAARAAGMDVVAVPSNGSECAELRGLDALVLRSLEEFHLQSLCNASLPALLI